jgi:hypothetical protein
VISLVRAMVLFALAFSLAFAGRVGAEPPAKAPAVDPKEEAEIKENIDKLDPADRKLALAQKFCAIEDENRLGVMGKPIKLMVKGKPVFICCGGCRKAAMAEPDKTLAKVEELKKKAAPAK